MNAIPLLGPEIALAVVAVAISAGGLISAAGDIWRPAAMGGIILAAVATATFDAGGLPPGPLATDALAAYTRWLALGSAALLIPWVAPVQRDHPSSEPTQLGLLLLTTVGVMLVGAANDLIPLWIGLELVSICVCLLLVRVDARASTGVGTGKYVLTGFLASVLLAWGFACLYAAGGSTDLSRIHDRLADMAGSWVLACDVGFTLVLVAIGLRVGITPLGGPTSQLAERSSSSAATVLLVMPRLAGFVALVRLAGATDGVLLVWPIVAVAAVVTMTVGNLVAIRTENLRRLLVGASTAQVGYILLALAAMLGSSAAAATDWDGGAAVLLCLVPYAAAMIGLYAALSCLRRGKEGRLETIDELAGLARLEGKAQRVLAWTIGVLLLSLAGIPPLAGAWGRLAVLAAATGVEAGFGVGVDVGGQNVRIWCIGLVVVGLANSVMTAVYCLRLVRVIFFRLPLGSPQRKPETSGAMSAAVCSALVIVATGLAVGPWFEFADQAARDVRVDAQRSADVERER